MQLVGVPSGLELADPAGLKQRVGEVLKGGWVVEACFVEASLPGLWKATPQVEESDLLTAVPWVREVLEKAWKAE